MEMQYVVYALLVIIAIFFLFLGDPYCKWRASKLQKLDQKVEQTARRQQAQDASNSKKLAVVQEKSKVMEEDVSALESKVADLEVKQAEIETQVKETFRPF